jgi:cell division protein FtsN
MSHRDYANRKPRNKPGARSRSTRGNARGQSRGMGQIPIIPTLLVFLLVGGFGYFLWSIKDTAKEVSADAVVTAPAKKTTKAIKKDPNALPPQPKEEWTYLEELEKKSVEVDVPESAKSTQAYQMQCGSFRQESQAQEMKAVIAFQGLEAQVRRSDGANGVWYKVVLGPYNGKREAQANAHKLERVGIKNCQIWLWVK